MQQVKAAYQPLLSGNLTTVGADPARRSRPATLQTSGLSSRGAMGVGISQLVTDFGRTASLADSAQAARRFAGSQYRDDQGPGAGPGGPGVLQRAGAPMPCCRWRRPGWQMQRLTLRQVQALAASSLKSTLDVSFAEVVGIGSGAGTVSGRERGEGKSRAAFRRDRGGADSRSRLTDVPLPGPLTDDVEAWWRRRCEIVRNSVGRQAEPFRGGAFRRRREATALPVGECRGVVGAIPVHRQNLSNQYGAAGVNVSIPFLNGGLYAAPPGRGGLPRAPGGEGSGRDRATGVGGRAGGVDRRGQRLAATGCDRES